MAAKKTTRKSKKKQTASDMFKLADVTESEDDTGSSYAVEEEVTISSNSEPLPRQKPQLVTRKEVSRSFGYSCQTQFTAFKTAPGGQAKPKKAKVIKPTENLETAEPALPTPTPGQPEAPEDPAVHVQIDPPEPSVDETILNPSTVEPSSSTNLPTTYKSDVFITGSRFVETGNPTVLARHSAKQEGLEK
ncbi:uncharacterized protein LOC125524238 isoform X2 [Triticum urartu]|nr:uncharacterized protein LOC125524238 isoform X2 [Triticum urartu]